MNYVDLERDQRASLTLGEDREESPEPHFFKAQYLFAFASGRLRNQERPRVARGRRNPATLTPVERSTWA